MGNDMNPPKETGRVRHMKMYGVRAVEVLCVLILFALGRHYAIQYVSTWNETPSFYQKYYGPAVMVALGRGFVNPSPNAAPALAEFLKLKRDEITDSDVPVNIPLSELSYYQKIHWHSMMLIGWLFKWFGIRWSALYGLYGVFSGCCVVFAYLLFRLGMGRVVSVGLALLFLYSPVYLYVLPHLRDFSKGPLILGILCCLGYLTVYPLRAGKLLMACAGMGLITGIGLGFRQDMELCIPLVVCTLLFFLPGSLLRQWSVRLTGCALFLLAVAVSGFPVLKPMIMEDGYSYHYMILGLTDPFIKAMGLGNFPYQFGCFYRDAYAQALVSANAGLHHGLTSFIPMPSPEYNHYAGLYMKEILRIFPADMLLRWYAAAATVLNYLPFTHYGEPPLPVTDAFKSLMNTRWECWGWLCGKGAVAAGMALMIIAARSFRLGLFSFLAVLFLGGSLSMQYSPRHGFHLEVFFWWAVGFILCTAARTGFRLACTVYQHRPLPGKQEVCRPVFRSAVFGVLCALLLLVPYCLLRCYQHGRVERYFRTCATAELIPLTAERHTDLEEEIVPRDFLDFNQFTPAERELRTQFGLLVLDVEPRREASPLWFKYRAANKITDYTYSLTIPPKADLPPGNVRVFFPVYNAPAMNFPGEREFVSVSGAPGMIKQLYKMRDPAQLPVYLNLILPADWKHCPHALGFSSQVVAEASGRRPVFDQ